MSLLRIVNYRIRFIGSNKTINLKHFSIPQNYLEQVKKHIDTPVKPCIYYCGVSQYSSTLFCMLKKDSIKVQVVKDLQKWNLNIIKDWTLISNQAMILELVSEANYCSKVDFADTYRQVRVKPEDEEKSAITTPLGLFLSRVMKQGNTNPSGTFT